jgi:hypothetical protein
MRLYIVDLRKAMAAKGTAPGQMSLFNQPAAKPSGAKATVKAHARKTKGGKVAMVVQHQRKKKPAKAKEPPVSETAAKPADMLRVSMVNTWAMYGERTHGLKETDAWGGDRHELEGTPDQWSAFYDDLADQYDQARGASKSSIGAVMKRIHAKHPRFEDERNRERANYQRKKAAERAAEMGHEHLVEWEGRTGYTHSRYFGTRIEAETFAEKRGGKVSGAKGDAVGGGSDAFTKPAAKPEPVKGQRYKVRGMAAAELDIEQEGMDEAIDSEAMVATLKAWDRDSQNLVVPEGKHELIWRGLTELANHADDLAQDSDRGQEQRRHSRHASTGLTSLATKVLNDKAPKAPDVFDKPAAKPEPEPVKAGPNTGQLMSRAKALLDDHAYHDYGYGDDGVLYTDPVGKVVAHTLRAIELGESIAKQGRDTDGVANVNLQAVPAVMKHEHDAAMAVGNLRAYMQDQETAKRNPDYYVSVEDIQHNIESTKKLIAHEMAAVRAERDKAAKTINRAVQAMPAASSLRYAVERLTDAKTDLGDQASPTNTTAVDAAFSAIGLEIRNNGGWNAQPASVGKALNSLVKLYGTPAAWRKRLRASLRKRAPEAVAEHGLAKEMAPFVYARAAHVLGNRESRPAKWREALSDAAEAMGGARLDASAWEA